MTVVEKRVQVNFQTNPILLERARKIVKANNLDMSKSFNLFLETIVATEQIPVMTEDELLKERLFRQLKAEVAESVAEYQAGNIIPLEEVKAEYNL